MIRAPQPPRTGEDYPVALEIKNVAALFKELQQKRHLADYDLAERFKRSEVLTLIEQVEQHLQDFAALQDSNDRRFFLVSLLVWKELAKR